jgi:hypothetical protein
VSVDVGGLENLIRDYAREKAECLGEGFVSQAMAEAPSRTGELIASISHDGAVDTGSSFTVYAHCDSDHARYVEYGRGPVHAENAKALALYNAATGFVERVGPQAANPFWRRTHEAWEAIVAGCAS